MSKMFYQRLAISNIKKNKQAYSPYILTCICSVMIFYTIDFICVNEEFNKSYELEILKLLLRIGTFILAIFTVIFLFYTNSFLIKRRKKEIGLYNILGMEKKHIAKVLFWENLIVALLSMTIGLIWGILLSKLMFLILIKIIKFTIFMGFIISIKCILETVILFSVIFALTLINNLTQIHLAKPIELLKGEEVGEKEPKTKWLLTLIGVLSLGTGYCLVLVIQIPMLMLYLFFAEVILIMIGTYTLFTAGSITFLKMLRKNKKFYYQKNHFINVSSMIYRIKQNAIGLSNICILSTAVLSIVFIITSLYLGIDDLLRTRYPKDILMQVFDERQEEMIKLRKEVKETASTLNVTIKDEIEYRLATMPMNQNKNIFTYADRRESLFNDTCLLVAIPLSDYNVITNQLVSLNEDEVLLYIHKRKIKGDRISISGNVFTIKERISHLPVKGFTFDILANGYLIVVPDERIHDIAIEGLTDHYGFDTDASPEEEIALTEAITQIIQERNVFAICEGLEQAREIFLVIFGGVLFIGIYLGVVFIMATVLIIYYKQISEGYEDKNRFEIMKKVGMTKDEIKKVIKSQVLMVFFLPLITAIIHFMVALKAIIKVFAMLSLMNTTLFLYCIIGTIVIFTFFYVAIYVLTSRTYYKIVS